MKVLKEETLLIRSTNNIGDPLAENEQ